jgi:hypothetical protein
VSEPDLRAPDYIKIAAQLISEHGWCGSNVDPIGHDCPQGLHLTRAAMWAVGGVGCQPRDLSTDQTERLAEVLDHLEAPLGLGMAVGEYERHAAGVSPQSVAFELLVAAVRYEGSLVSVE